MDNSPIIEPSGAHKRAQYVRRRDSIITALALFVAIGLALARIFLFQPFNMTSESMRPNIVAIDVFWASKWNYGFSRLSTPFFPQNIRGRIGGKPPERGEIVVFKLPRDNKTDYIKRLIGLPGDRIQIVGGKLIINDTPLTYKLLKPETITVSSGDKQNTTRFVETLPNGRNYIIYDLITDGPFDNTEVYVVPEGHYFMMGDNRDNSSDSRADPLLQGGVGFVPAENLVGRVMIKDKQMTE
jgi:signal peptidase I